MDRKAIARALAKAQAYHECGQHQKADLWVARLVGLLGSAGILNPASPHVQAALARDPE